MEKADKAQGSILAGDRQWAEVQKKTFMKWINGHVKKRSLAIDTVETGLTDGNVLMHLISVLYDAPIPRHNRNAKARAQVLDNVSIALKMTEDAGVPLHFVKPMSILDGELTLTLGLCWSIIHHYQISGISVEDMNAKEGLLRWCQKATAGYAGVDVQNFTTSWRSGLAFAALIHAHRPDLINFDSLKKDTPEQSLAQAFDVADKQLGITQLLDVEDVRAEKPDEKSIMTYVSEFFHVFSSQNEAATNGKRVAEYIKFNQAAAALRSTYESKARELSEWTQYKIQYLRNPAPTPSDDTDYSRAKASLASFWQYKANEKPRYSALKTEVEHVGANLKTKLIAGARPAYSAPAGLSPADLDQQWRELTEAEGSSLTTAKESLRVVRENLCAQYATGAKKFTERVHSTENAVNGITGAPEEQAARVQPLRDDVKALASELAQVIEWHERCVAAGIRDNSHSPQTVEELALLLEELNTVLSNKQQLIENLAARQAEKARIKAELEAIERANEAVRIKFAEKANEFAPWIASLKERVEARSGDLASQTSDVEQVQLEARGGTERLQELQNISEELRRRGVLVNVHTTLTTGELQLFYDELMNAAHNKLALLSNQAARRAEKERIAADNASREVAMDNLRRIYNETAVALDAYLQRCRTALGALDGHLSEQQDAVVQAQEDLQTTGASLLTAFEDANRRVIDNAIGETLDCKLSAEELGAAYHETLAALAGRAAFVEKQLQLREQQKIPEKQLAEFTSSFKSFDKARINALTRSEFTACLNSLGQKLSAVEQHSLYAADEAALISYDEFMTLMISKYEIKDDPETVIRAFAFLAGNKPHAGRNELSRHVEADALEWFILRGNDQGVDYAADVHAAFEG